MFYVFSFVQRNEGKQLQAAAHLLPSELDTILLRSPCSQNLRFVTVRVLAKIVRVQRHCACGKQLTILTFMILRVPKQRVCGPHWSSPAAGQHTWSLVPDWLWRTSPHLAPAQHQLSTWPRHDASWVHTLGGSSNL